MADYEIPRTATLSIVEPLTASAPQITLAAGPDFATLRATFAAQRDDELRRADDELRPLVIEALDGLYAGDPDWSDGLIAAAEVLWLETYDQTDPTGASMEQVYAYGQGLDDHLGQTSTAFGTTTEAQTDTITRWLATYTINDATHAAAVATSVADMVWVTMGDEDVRPAHAALDGEVQPVGGTFDVGGTSLRYPGDPTGPPDAWINCRCVLLPLEAQMTAAAAPAVDVDDAPDDAPTTGYEDLDSAVPWHGIVAPVETPSGDRRMFGAGSITFRDLPLPLRWQKVDAPGHDGSVVVGNITRLWEDDGLIHAEGMFATSAEAAEVITLMAEGMLRGVSVDLDGDTVFDLITDDGEPFDIEGYSPGDPEPIKRVISGRVTSAAIVPIPAFQEAWVRLGDWDEDPEQVAEVLTAAGGCVPCAAAEMDGYYEQLDGFAISEASWDGAASRFDDDEWKRATIVDRGESYETPKERYAVPIREPNGDLSRAAVHNAAARIDQVDAPAEAVAAGKRKLVAAYRQLDEDPPEGLQAAAASWSDVYAPAEPAPGDDAGRAVQVGDVVTWTEPHEEAGDGIHDEDVTEHTGQVVAIEGDMATVVDEDGAEVSVPVTELAVAAPAEGEYASAPGTRDGPGWITNPEDTQRLRTYWTRGAGAAKIRWGAPGDFNRCRNQLRKYIPNAHYLAGTCANMHKVALGVWPGQHASESLTAAASPAFSFATSPAVAAAPGAWFDDPGLDGPTALRLDWDGDLNLWRVRGHLAAWGTCHIGLGLSVGDGQECVTPPSSPSGYAYFRTDAVRSAEGDIVPVGHITLGTGHAPASMANRPAAAHYDNTGAVVADVAAGEDAHGIWVAGVLRPGADPEVLQAASLSGDWRTIGGKYELVAALGVNVPGFPIPRMQIGASAGTQTSLVAAGVVLPRGEVTFDTASLVKDVYNEIQTIGRRADRRRVLATRMRSVRRDRLAAKLVASP